MEALLAKLEEIKASLVNEGVQSLQTDAYIEPHVLAALPKVRSLIETLKQVQAQVSV